MLRRALDGTEAALQRAGAVLARPAPLRVAVVALLVLAIALRLPLAAHADEVPNGHNDANIYFNQVHAAWLKGDFYPDHDRGSGWQWLLWLTFQAFDVPPGEWTHKGVPLEGDAAHAARLAYVLSAMLSVGIVTATYLLARQILTPLQTLGALLLVVVDPYLLFTSHSAMSEPPYTALFVLALAAALKARERPAWLVAVGALMALAFVMRVNGLVMLVMALAYALVLMPRGRRLAWSGAAVVAFLVVSAPYLAWREVDGPGAMDFGTNSRMWADNLWDMEDRYWTERMAGVPEPHKETLGEYLATHTLGDILQRLGTSAQYIVFDLVGYGKWAPSQTEGGVWPGTPPDGSALTPLLVALAAVAAFTAWRRRALWFLPLALAFSLATFLWVYPLVRSVRYWAPLIPLVAIWAMVGWEHLARHVPRPALVATLLFGGYAGLYAVATLARLGDGLALLAVPDFRALVLALAALWIALAFAPDVPRLASALRRIVPFGKRAPEP